jgi:hypothetical protein
MTLNLFPTTDLDWKDKPGNVQKADTNNIKQSTKELGT